jgi:predicted DNA repair protein MutK
MHGPSDLAHGIQHAVEGATGALAGLLGWVSYAGVSALFGLVLGAVIALVLHKVLRIGAH